MRVEKISIVNKKNDQLNITFGKQKQQNKEIKSDKLLLYSLVGFTGVMSLILLDRTSKTRLQKLFAEEVVWNKRKKNVLLKNLKNLFQNRIKKQKAPDNPELFYFYTEFLCYDRKTSVQAAFFGFLICNKII